MISNQTIIMYEIFFVCLFLLFGVGFRNVAPSISLVGYTTYMVDWGLPLPVFFVTMELHFFCIFYKWIIFFFIFKTY